VVTARGKSVSPWVALVLLIGRSRIKQWIPQLADDDRRVLTGRVVG
jgi:hypothetical protein